jgi:hypothetical protein
MVSREQSVRSAEYTKSARPAILRSVFQVSMWVRESLVLPSVQRNATGTCATDPSARHGPYYEWGHMRGGKLVHRSASVRNWDSEMLKQNPMQRTQSSRL